MCVVIQLRDALVSDLDLLRYWDTQPHVIASDPNDDWNWGIELHRSVDWRLQLIAQIDSTPIGFFQIIDPQREESHYWGEVEPDLRAIDIWIGEQKNLNHGYGTQMMLAALKLCFSDPKVTAVLVDPLADNNGAHRFYRRLGFSFIEKRVFDQDTCYVFRLDRLDYERHHLINKGDHNT